MGMDSHLVSVTSDGNVEIGYWRKAKSLHDWFVDNTPVVNKECGHCEHRVSKDSLKRLLSFLKDKVDGENNFVDGGWWQLENTREIISNALTCENKIRYISYW
jgi:hypothetical protein